MNTKIKLELSVSELQALFNLLNSCTMPFIGGWHQRATRKFNLFNSCTMPLEGDREYIMAVHLARKLFLRIASRLVHPPPGGKTSKLSMHIADAIALTTMINMGADPSLAWNDYNRNLILKINNIVNQKLA